MGKEKSIQKIYSKLKEILEANKDGLRYSEIVERIQETLPEIPIKTIHGSMWKIRQKILVGKIKEIAQPERGFYVLAKYLTTEKISKQIPEKPLGKVKEEDFYQPFANYLENDLQECTKAIPLGGNKFGDKWGTPDVLGVYKFSEYQPIRPPLEIISAEIKIDTNQNQLITAFGQACAYKLFSHKVYLVIPQDADEQSGSRVSRIESLCLKFGIGLILFDSQNPEKPNFTIRARAIKSEPDYFYVNSYISRLPNKEKKELLY